MAADDSLRPDDGRPDDDGTVGAGTEAQLRMTLCDTETLQCPWRQDDDGTVGAGTEAQLRMTLCDTETLVSMATR